MTRTVIQSCSAESGEVLVDGVPIAWRGWGPADASTVVLVHGGAASQRWWDPVVSELDTSRRIVTFDLSGHGASGHRPRYDACIWARELDAVIVAATCGHAVVVAHSMGGRLVLAGASELRDRLTGVVLLDVPMELAVDPELFRKLRKPRRVYATRDEALRAFRVVPGTVLRADLAEQVAARSLVRAGSTGWAYAGDPQVVGRIPDDLVIDGALATAAPIRVVRGGRSPYLVELRLDLLATRPGGSGTVAVVPDAGHHIMLDDPVGLAAAIRRQVADLGHDA